MNNVFARAPRFRWDTDRNPPVQAVIPAPRGWK
jgi:hypothetical protein